jgi:SPP1 family predicted phage head-tail adaptor
VSRPGEMRNRVDIMRKAVPTDPANQNAYGEPTAQDTVVATVWASIEPIRGEEFFQNMQVQGQVTHRGFVRGNVDVNTRDWLMWGSRKFEIVSLFDVRERGDFIEMMLRESL